MHLQVSTERIGEATVVHAAGELDLHTAPVLQEPLDAAVGARAPLIVVDLSQVDFMDSTGLSVIVATVVAGRDHGGEVRVVSDRDKITRIFTLTGVDKKVRVVDSVARALD